MTPRPNPESNPLRDRFHRIEGESLADCLARLREDMHARAQAGPVPRVEEYLAAFPELAGDREAVVDLVAMERLLRVEAGEDATTAFYVDRFPDHHREIGDQFDFDQMLDGLAADGVGPDDEDDDSGSKPRREGRPRLPEPYRPIRPLGEGSFGEVWLGRDVRLGRPVAIKILIKDGKRVSARFRREAEITANINHSNVCKLFDHQLDHKPPFLVLEYVSGRTLREILKPGTHLEIDEAVQIAREVADGCRAFHGEWVVHRDLKPENIKKDKYGHIKILDLGVARPFEPDLDGITSENSLVGSIPYMSPEQVDGRAPVEAPTDQFALGSILYEMLTGSPPFLVKPDPKGVATLLRIAECRPDDPRKARPEIDEALASIVLRMLQAKPGDRFGSMDEVVEVLDAYRAGNRKPVPIRPSRNWRRRAVVAALPVVLAGAFGLGMAIKPGPEKPKRRAFSAIDVMTLIRDDLDRTDRDGDPPPWRYFTLTNLADDPAITPDVLRRHRDALTELVAALGVGTVAPPEPVDPDGLVLRVDIGALGWSNEWTRRLFLVVRNPYALHYPDDATSPALRNVARDVERRVGEVSEHYPAMARVDWFLATFSQDENARALLDSAGAGPEEVEARVVRLSAFRRRWKDLLNLYERPVDLASAARELGLADEAAVRRAILQLPSRTGGEDRLGLGPLTEGKTVPRSTWAFSDMPYGTFGQVSEQLKLGRRLLRR